MHQTYIYRYNGNVTRKLNFYTSDWCKRFTNWEFRAAYCRFLPCRLMTGKNEDCEQSPVLRERPSGRNVTGRVRSTRTVLVVCLSAITQRSHYADRYPIACFATPPQKPLLRHMRQGFD